MNITSTAPALITRHDAEYIGQFAADALTAELNAWPKPGLVSPFDNGSHEDMDYHTFVRSIDVLQPFFTELAYAGSKGAAMTELRTIGKQAEANMLLATDGVNTHRGAIFALGLIAAAAGALRTNCSPLTAQHLSNMVIERWGQDIQRGPIPIASHGSTALRRYGAGGARVEAATGFPHILRVALPALHDGHAIAGPKAAQLQAFFALLATMEDTNLLHRGGRQGLEDARQEARDFLNAGGVGQAEWQAQAFAMHQRFITRRLSPGGSADLLAATIFIDMLTSFT